MRDRIIYAILFVAAIGYLAAEFIYNSMVLDATTSAKFSEPYISNLSNLGHWMFAIGATLTLLKFAMSWNTTRANLTSSMRQIWILLCLICFSLFVFFNVSTFVINTVIEHFSDKRYEAYYITNFRFGLANGEVKYSTFIKSDADNFTPTDKALLANSFILMYGDSKLADDLKNDRQTIASILAKQSINSGRFKKAWESYQEGMKTLDTKYEEYKNSAPSASKISSEIEKELRKKWNAYKSAEDKIDRAKQEASYKKADALRKLTQYFQNKDDYRAQASYEKAMQKEFGHVISPDEWCDDSICPSSSAYDRVIELELEKQWNTVASGLPRGIGSFEEFKHTNIVKEKISKSLRNKNIDIGSGNDYSIAQIRNALLPKGMSKDEFLAHPKVASKISIHFKKLGSKYGGKDHLYIKDQRVFFDKIFSPNIKVGDITPYIYEKMDFNKNKKAIELGDEAIKALFSPTISLMFSAFFGILNLFILLYSKMPFIDKLLRQKGKFAKPLIGTISFCIIFTAPVLFSEENQFLESKTDGKTKHMVSWITSVEPIVYTIGKPLRNQLPPSFVDNFLP